MANFRFWRAATGFAAVAAAAIGLAACGDMPPEGFPGAADAPPPAIYRVERLPGFEDDLLRGCRAVDGHATHSAFRVKAPDGFQQTELYALGQPGEVFIGTLIGQSSAQPGVLQAYCEAGVITDEPYPLPGGPP